MKTLLPATTALVMFAAVGAAGAADLPVKAPPMTPVVAPAFSWTGFYLNGGFGYGLWAADETTIRLDGTCAVCVPQRQGGTGWFGTVGAGFDYQLNDRIVAGVFTDANLSRIKGTVQDEFPFFAGQIKETWSWAAGARVGWLVTPAVLSYVNAGWSETHFNSANMVDTFVGGPTGFATPAFSRGGFFVGGGMEAMFAPGWFWRNEYRFADYGTATLTDTCVNPALCGAGQFFNITFHPIVQTVSSEIVYRFNWDGRAVASAAAAGPASAPIYKAPAAAPTTYNWTGFYLNGGLGYGLWAADTTTLIPAGFPGAGTCFLCVPQTQGGKGWFGTVGGGFDYQFSNRIVAGVFADADFSSISGTIQDQGPVLTGTVTEKWSWAGGARIGWLVTPALLTYVDGGLSQTHFNGANMFVDFFPPFGPTATAFSTPAFTKSGFFVGGGMEVMFAPGWFWRNEYRYADYGTANLTDICAGVSGSAACGFTASPQATFTFHPIVQTVRSELVYKFNWSGPAVAKN
jgi:outer membrane immunogenic protein